MKYKIVSISICIMIILTALTGIAYNVFFKYTVKQEMHIINKLNLKHFKTCYNSVSGSLQTRLNKCLSDSLSSAPTGDAFVVRLPDMAIVWDNSVDCKTGKQMYLTKNSVCKLSKDPQSCEKLAAEIHKGYNGSGDWYFDNSMEVDDWIILPNETHNMDGSLRADVGLKEQYAVVQGAQTDEFLKPLNPLKYFIIFLITILLLFETLLLCIVKKFNEGEIKYAQK